jgi:hypothetical protein
MEHNASIWKANFSSGLLMGLIAVVYTLAIYFLNLLFNAYQGYVFYLIQLIVLFVLLKS